MKTTGGRQNAEQNLEHAYPVSKLLNNLMRKDDVVDDKKLKELANSSQKICEAASSQSVEKAKTKKAVVVIILSKRLFWAPAG